jgi:hypothetical protein
MRVNRFRCADGAAGGWEGTALLQKSGILDMKVISKFSLQFFCFHPVSNTKELFTNVIT